MKSNSIGNDGIAAIAGALSNSQIRELNVRECDITLTGARSLAEGLLVNNSVRILDVSSNSITVEGARLILQSAVNNGVCQEVVIYDKVFSKLRGDEDYRNDDEVKRMMITLEQRKIVVIRGCAACCNTDCNGNRHQDKRRPQSRKSGEEYVTCSEVDDQLVRQEVVLCDIHIDCCHGNSSCNKRTHNTILIVKMMINL